MGPGRSICQAARWVPVQLERAILLLPLLDIWHSKCTLVLICSCCCCSRLQQIVDMPTDIVPIVQHLLIKFVSLVCFVKLPMVKYMPIVLLNCALSHALCSVIDLI